jgi:hypothetical protein
VVVNEGTLLDCVETVNMRFISFGAHEDFLNDVQFDEEEDNDDDREDKGGEGCKAGDGLIDEPVEVGCEEGMVTCMSRTAEGFDCHAGLYFELG